jgi:uncharacterized NAD-dependent epimerase/dehydratase family protein
VHERLLHFVKPARTIGVVLDTSELTDDAAHAAIAQAESETGLPADDPVRNTGAKLWRSVEGLLSHR